MKRIFTALSGATLLLVCQDAYSKSYGTAFFINSSGGLLTNSHVISGCSRVFIKTHDEKIFSIRKIARSDKYDMAYMVASGVKGYPALAIDVFSSGSVSVPVVGQMLFTAGFSDPVNNSFDIVALDGVSISTQKEGNIPPYNGYMASGVDFGASGSPVLNETGGLVGIVHSKTDDIKISYKNGTLSKYNNYTIFHNNNAIADFIVSIGADYTTAQGARKMLRLERVGLGLRASVLVICR